MLISCPWPPSLAAAVLQQLKAEIAHLRWEWEWEWTTTAELDFQPFWPYLFFQIPRKSLESQKSKVDKPKKEGGEQPKHSSLSGDLWTGWKIRNGRKQEGKSAGKARTCENSFHAAQAETRNLLASTGQKLCLFTSGHRPARCPGRPWTCTRCWQSPCSRPPRRCRRSRGRPSSGPAPPKPGTI